jgi:serine phosphatase RsbU (regulator of sigma subunit)
LPDDLELPFQQNHITFIFKAVSLKKPSKLQYRYMLEGYDKDWIYSNESSAVYASLEPSSYTFMVQTSLDGVHWSSPVNHFDFVITPPFWQSKWFYLLCTLIVLSWIYSYYKIQKSNAKLNKQKEVITEQKNGLEYKNKAIIDSIRYAKRIQNSILPKRKFVEKELKESFISYLPKDIVSGDFYWVEKANNKVYFAVADCTGHGVPGAMVSIMCKGVLTQAVKEMKISSPANILDVSTSLLISKIFDSDEETVNDGMDIALCAIDFEKMQLEFSGANNGLYLVRNNEIITYKADKQPVGKFDYISGFTNHHIDLKKGDMIYLFSDGYADQFGGENNKKFKSKQFRDLLLSVSAKDVLIQKEIIEETFVKWKGANDQVDDVCVMGVRI